jgi:hypothetical protein
MPREEIRSDRSTSPTGSQFNAFEEMSRDWMGACNSRSRTRSQTIEKANRSSQFLMPLRPIRNG